MTYDPQTWANGAEGETPITADALNYMERGIQQGHRYYGWGTFVPPAQRHGDSEFETVDAFDATVRPGERVTILERPEGRWTLTSETGSQWNPGPTFNPESGPNDGPVLFFGAAEEKGVDNEVLANDSGSNFAVIFIPSGPRYTIMLPGALGIPQALWMVGANDDEFYFTNGDNSISYTTDLPAIGEPHLVIVTLAEAEGESRVILDDTLVAGPDRLWTASDEEWVDETFALSNVGEDSWKFLWAARFNAGEQYGFGGQINRINNYARDLGVTAFPPPGDD